LVGDSLGEIAEKMVATDVLVGEIASAAREQAQGIEQINQAIGQMDRMTQNTASSAEETAAAAEQMNAQAACLNDQVDQLRRLVGARPGAGTAGPGHRVRPAAAGRARRPATLAAAPGRPRAIPMPGDPPSPGPRHS
jgi:ABC-type transporter Mla subunit MlaD